MNTAMPRISAPHHHQVRTFVTIDGHTVWDTVHALSAFGPYTVCGHRIDHDNDEPVEGDEGLTCARCVAELEAGTDRLTAAVTS